MDESAARELASEKALADGLKLSPGDEWTTGRFTDGWLFTLGPSDPLAVTGSHHFIVLDTGSVIRESGSMPPFEYVAKHSSAGKGLALTVDGGRLAYDDEGVVNFQPL